MQKVFIMIFYTFNSYPVYFKNDAARKGWKLADAAHKKNLAPDEYIQFIKDNLTKEEFEEIRKDYKELANASDYDIAYHLRSDWLDYYGW